jgi:hypothetical protein
MKMAVQHENEFSDPVLKQAVCRCWASECASEALWKRVASVFEVSAGQPVVYSPSDTHAPAPRMTSGARLGWMVWPSAIAALLAVAFAVFYPFHPTQVATAIPLPATLVSELVHTHDHCCQLKNHQGIPVPKDDDTAIAKYLSEHFDRAVVVYHPATPGWVFRGASLCDVGTTESGHLVFVNGPDALSIFNLPRSTLRDPLEGSEYSATDNDHSIFGFVKDGALYCMVSSGASGRLSIEQMKQMETQMHPEKIAENHNKPERVLLTELLQPIGR